ncbi:hypothetical protein CCR75_005816 [Bremia lactucae]|uniref:Uncharacterized protein n=1 Tax=Bremia lactucae TaxID=4779 RepID=A0A976IFL3_BRELC|nr:hypothetical protein CCR75_005817 [Bremia lactucae]TDH69660.1 hypothetical protein CCR75_005816 [Bremia lactucae]
MGIEVNYNRERGMLHICQSQFIDRRFERFGQNSADLSRNPYVFGQNLSESDGGEKADSKKIRELIGFLLSIAVP